MSTPSWISTALTLSPYLVVWWVIKLKPNINFVFYLTSSGVFKIWTPPFNPDVRWPFPLPPAWTWAFKIRIPSFTFKSLATCYACSGVVAMSPFWTKTPNLLMTSLLWYSWRSKYLLILSVRPLLKTGFKNLENIFLLIKWLKIFL